MYALTARAFLCLRKKTVIDTPRYATATERGRYGAQLMTGKETQSIFNNPNHHETVEDAMLFSLIVMLLVGIAMIGLGLSIWKKQNINLIHSYHYQNVKAEDAIKYTSLCGKAVCLMGAGCCFTGLMDYFTGLYAFDWAVWGVCFVAGMVIFVYAQYKYNGSIFS